MITHLAAPAPFSIDPTCSPADQAVLAALSSAAAPAADGAEPDLGCRRVQAIRRTRDGSAIGQRPANSLAWLLQHLGVAVPEEPQQLGSIARNPSVRGIPLGVSDC